MKRVVKHILLLMVAIAAVGCIEDYNLGDDGHNPSEIRLWADVGYSPNFSYSKSATRGNANSTSGIIDAATDVTMNIAMVRIDENHTPSYPAFLNCSPSPILAEMGTPNPNDAYARDIEFKSAAQFFYNDIDYVKFAAWYPWKPTEDGYEYETSSTATTVRIPITGDSDVMYGDVATGNQANGFNTMEFNHALCIYRIYVYSMQDETDSNGIHSSSWGVLEEMSIENLPTSCVLTLPGENGKFGVNYEGNETLCLSSPDNNIFFSPGDNIPSGLKNRRMVAKCVAAPPAEGVLNIQLKTSEAEANQRVSIARNFKAGYAYDIVLRFSNHGFINADVSVGEWSLYRDVIEQDVDVDMFYNLSNYESANSYIVNSANYGYCFDGTVKGNGDTSLVGGDARLNPGYIDILWDDTPMITVNGVERKALVLDKHELSEGRVLFHVQGASDRENKALLTEGNVVIAAYDHEGGDVIWTWHIWLTDRVKSQGSPNGYIVQDRNLGATSSADKGSMDGLYYQWGRPTPFKPASSGVYGNNVTIVPSNPASVATVEAAVANPTTLYGSGDNSRYDWLSSEKNNLWGYSNEYTDIVKTMYDPCPAGYMVADVRVWQNIASYEKTNGWQSGKGVNLSVASSDVWYPFQGYIESDGSYKSYTGVRLWSSVVDNSTSHNPYELQYSASKTAATNAANSHRNRALPVRCVSSHSTAIVTNLSASQTANSYMVHRSGYYKFKATVRGNGVGSLLPLGGTMPAEISAGLSTTIKPSKVDIMWWQGDFETVKSTTQTPDASDLNLIPMQILNNGELDEDGYVLFYVGEFRKGNVGLAAYDVDGEILWSWHIWFTDKPNNVLTGNYTFMDRNLGATYVPDTSGTRLSFANNKQRLATYGFYYQWGRKDPIMGPPAYDSGDETVNGNPKSSQYWVKDYLTGEWSSRSDISTDSSASVPEVTRNPLTFYKSTSTSGNNNCGWYESTFIDGYTNVAMWGYAVADYSIPGQTFSKTMHDPCPPGYRTPFHHAWTGYTNGEDAGMINLSNSEASFDSYGLVFNRTNFERAWYPFMGYRHAQTGAYTDVSQEGRLVTGMPMGQFNTRSYRYTTRQTGQVSSSGADNNPNNATGPAYAMSARCQKE